MRIVINVGIVLGLLAFSCVVLFVAYNVVWSIHESRLPKPQKWNVLKGIGVVLLVMVFWFYPRNWEPEYPSVSPSSYVQHTALGVGSPAPQAQVQSPQPQQPEKSQSSVIVQRAEPPVRTYIAPTPPVVVVQQPPVHVDPWAAFSATAQSVVAKEVANTGEEAFGKQFVVKCLDATSSTRQITSYGMNSSVVVITGRFKISSIDQIDGQIWSKSFSVSETVFPEEFQGLDSETTRVVLANSLRDKLLDDKETLTAFSKSFK